MLDIAKYYSGENPNLVGSFRKDFRATIRAITRNPYLRSEDRPGIRHWTLAVFPYYVFNRLDDDQRHVHVEAVIHVRRDPTYAASRFGGSEHE
jgi:plasmid stabilization system protein ParE